MNKVTLKVDFQGVNHPGQLAKPIDSVATAAILKRWADLAELVAEKIAITERQHFSWYIHIGCGWAGDPDNGLVVGLAQVTVMENAKHGGRFAATRRHDIFILPNRYGEKFTGEVSIDEIIVNTAKRLQEE